MFKTEEDLPLLQTWAQGLLQGALDRERTRDCSPGHAGKEGPQLARTGASPAFPRAAAPVGVFSRRTHAQTTQGWLCLLHITHKHIVKLTRLCYRRQVLVLWKHLAK